MHVYINNNNWQGKLCEVQNLQDELAKCRIDKTSKRCTFRIRRGRSETVLYIISKWPNFAQLVYIRRHDKVAIMIHLGSLWKSWPTNSKNVVRPNPRRSHWESRVMRWFRVTITEAIWNLVLMWWTKSKASMEVYLKCPTESTIKETAKKWSLMTDLSGKYVSCGQWNE